MKTFQDEAPGIPLPPAPVLTRWGTWLDACNYYCEHFEIVKKVINSFDSDSAASIKVAQDLLSNSELQGKLAYIKSNFGFLPRIITSLEQCGCPLSNQVDLVKSTASDLGRVEGEVGKLVSDKMEKVLEKNQGFGT